MDYKHKLRTDANLSNNIIIDTKMQKITHKWLDWIINKKQPRVDA